MRKNRKIYLKSILLFSIIFSSCALGRKGAGDLSFFESTRPENLKDKTKKEIILLLGVPKTIVLEKEREFWSYNKRGGWFAYLPLISPPLGVSKGNNLVLIFKKDKVVEYYIDNKDFSFGIINIPGAIAN